MFWGFWCATIGAFMRVGYAQLRRVQVLTKLKFCLILFGSLQLISPKVF